MTFFPGSWILILSGRGRLGLVVDGCFQSFAVTNRLRTRSTVRRLVPNAETISSSSNPRRLPKEDAGMAEFRPPPFLQNQKLQLVSRSSGVRETLYLSIAELLFLGHTPLQHP